MHKSSIAFGLGTILFSMLSPHSSFIPGPVTLKVIALIDKEFEATGKSRTFIALEEDQYNRVLVELGHTGQRPNYITLKGTEVFSKSAAKMRTPTKAQVKNENRKRTARPIRREQN